jgi:hypothetical protein
MTAAELGAELQVVLCLTGSLLEDMQLNWQKGTLHPE